MSENAATNSELTVSSTSFGGSAGDYLSLLKPRVMSLVVFTGAVGLLVAPGDIHPVIGLTALLCVALGAGASGALNMWYDADIDRIMTRTAGRPIPAGRMAPGEALGFGATLAVGSVLVMGLAVNLTAAALLALTIGFYLFVYTMWLKRRTPQNIVIGGASGALPPVIGWAAVTGDVSLSALVLFAIIFIWTPPHFWALALYKSGEYEKAGIPMLPVVRGKRVTRNQILIYSIVLAPLAVLPTILDFAGPIYGWVAGFLGAVFLAYALWIWWSASERAAKGLFAYSIAYLFLIFSVLLVDSLWGAATLDFMAKMSADWGW
ncbi:MAG TPA: protoheme IX farnesyltransferase [Sneathiellales bacterium]|nr:protoheme IX farnesyltransferase [Sneathiellales bacterium]